MLAAALTATLVAAMLRQQDEGVLPDARVEREAHQFLRMWMQIGPEEDLVDLDRRIENGMDPVLWFKSGYGRWRRERVAKMVEEAIEQLNRERKAPAKHFAVLMVDVGEDRTHLPAGTILQTSRHPFRRGYSYQATMILTWAHNPLIPSHLGLQSTVPLWKLAIPEDQNEAARMWKAQQRAAREAAKNE